MVHQLSASSRPWSSISEHGYRPAAPFLAWAASLALASAAPAAPLAAQGVSCPSPAALTAGLAPPLSHVRYLSDDALGGREVGSAGERCAAEYLVASFRALGLEPGAVNGSWFQPFSVPKGAALASDNDFTISGVVYEVGKDWTPLGFSASASLTRPLVFGGFGLSRPGVPDDRYIRMDLADKVVVVEWGDPDAQGGGGMRADPHFKATVAAGRGAAGLVVLLPPDRPLPAVDAETRAALPIPVMIVAGGVAQAVREAAERSAEVRVRTDVRPVTGEARNVLALLSGSDPARRGEHIVIGAHYDHLGHGGEGSLDPDSRAVHNGADDNASGTTGLLEIAERLMRGPRPAQSVLFIAFTGEEKGLWGSARFVAEPTIDLAQTVAMLNLDMVGRMVDDQLTVYGIATAEEMESLVSEVNAGLARPMKIGLSPDGYGPSDHSSFYGAGIPVLHFFTNTHEDYHRPSDDWDKINAEGLSRVADLAAGIARRLAGDGQTVAMNLTPVLQHPPAPTAPGATTNAYGGVYLGTIPDMMPRDFGLRLTGVREGSPAERAGLRAGDVIVEFDGKPIGDIYAYTYAMQATQAGDEVVILVERDGERLRLTAVMGTR